MNYVRRWLAWLTSYIHSSVLLPNNSLYKFVAMYLSYILDSFGGQSNASAGQTYKMESGIVGRIMQLGCLMKLINISSLFCDFVMTVIARPLFLSSDVANCTRTRSKPTATRSLRNNRNRTGAATESNEDCEQFNSKTESLVSRVLCYINKCTGKRSSTIGRLQFCNL